MEIRVLQYFLAIAREESISRAAESLHVTQPTLSRQIAQLEEEIGAKLFERGAKRIALTREGMLLRRRAQEILALVDKTSEELSQQNQQLEGRIAIGCGEIASVEQLTELMNRFHTLHPLVHFDLFTANADQVRERMDRGLLDIGLLLEPVNIERYAFVRLDVRERWCALMPPNHPLAVKNSVTREDLASLPLILPRRQGVQAELASWFGPQFERLNVVCTSNFTSNAAALVRHGLGCALVIEVPAPLWNAETIACRPLAPELTATSVLAWKREQPFSPTVTEFIAYTRARLSGAAQSQ